MRYAQDLLNAARVIAAQGPESQALLRRAVSTAYYAVFHLLIEDACSRWSHEDQRLRLARQFDHKRMRDASAMTAKRSQGGGSLWVVASAFVYLQERRHEADYDLSGTFSAADADTDVSLAESAFQSWERIREDESAKDYLFALLFRDRS